MVALPLAVIALGGLAAEAAPTGVRADDSWIVLSNNRDGAYRTYSVRDDGSRLSPLVPAGAPLVPAAVSSAGGLIAYRAGDGLYVSRADGGGYLRLVDGAVGEGEAAFSPNGKLLAFTFKAGIWIVRSDGRGLRRLTSGRFDGALDWSPDGKSLVFMRVLDDDRGRYAVVVQPLRGKYHVLVRCGPNDDWPAETYRPAWSPDGRWIAYLDSENAQRRDGLTLVRPNGESRHRVTREAGDPGNDEFDWSPDGRWIAYHDQPVLYYIAPNGKQHRISTTAAGPVAWSPDGRQLAFPLLVQEKGKAVAVGGDIAVANGDGRGPRRLKLSLGREPYDLTWSPNSRQIAFVGQTAASVFDDPFALWVVDGNGKGLRRLTSEGDADVYGWSGRPPILPQASPIAAADRVVAADAVATTMPVTALAADGGRVAFAPRPTATDCEHVTVWAPGEDALARLGPLPSPCLWSYEHGVVGLALAGSRAAWLAKGAEAQGQDCVFTKLRSAAVGAPLAVVVTQDGLSCKGEDPFHLRGDGDLLVAAEGSSLVRIGVGTEKCGGSICTTLRQDAQAGPVDSVFEGLIATRKPGQVTVIDEQGRVVRTFGFAPADVSAARFDGTRLIVARSSTLESYDVSTGSRSASQPLPTGYQLADADGGIAVLRQADAILLLGLDNGRSLTITPGKAPVLADLETPGLYYSYATAAGEGRVVFVPRATLDQQLGLS